MVAMANTREYLKIIYYLKCKEIDSPVKATIRIPIRYDIVTLGDFKEITNRHGYRYFFTVYHKHFGPLKEEFVSDEDVLPMVGHRIESWLIERNSSITSSLVELYKYSSSSPCRRHEKQKYQLIQNIESAKSKHYQASEESTNKDFAYGHRKSCSPSSQLKECNVLGSPTSAFGHKTDSRLPYYPRSLQSRLKFWEFLETYPYYTVDKFCIQSPISQQPQSLEENSRVLKTPPKNSRCIHPETKLKAENNYPTLLQGSNERAPIKKDCNNLVRLCDPSPKGYIKSSYVGRLANETRSVLENVKQNKETPKKYLKPKQLRFFDGTEKAAKRNKESLNKWKKGVEKQVTDGAVCSDFEEILESHMFYEELVQHPQLAISKSKIYPLCNFSSSLDFCSEERCFGSSYVQNILSDSCQSLCNFPMRDDVSETDCPDCRNLAYSKTTDQGTFTGKETPFLKHEFHEDQNSTTEKIIPQKEIVSKKDMKRNPSIDIKSILKYKPQVQSTSNMCDLFWKKSRTVPGNYVNENVNGPNDQWFNFQMQNFGKRTASLPSIKRQATHECDSSQNFAFHPRNLSRYRTRDISLLAESSCSSCNMWQIGSDVGLHESEVSLCSFSMADDYAEQAEILEIKL